MSEKVVRPFEGTRQQSSRTEPSVRYEVAKGCYMTLFDDGRVVFMIDPGRADRELKPPKRDSRYPGAWQIETGKLKE